ncbi:MAG: peptidoglycan DD-metalloendopeptidase family protein [Gammaproteobacteria bacterium]|nr:peptidoglycan DD-metalloendopeptidase family protein [Gammaproteobacteria bacterium]
MLQLALFTTLYSALLSVALLSAPAAGAPVQGVEDREQRLQQIQGEISTLRSDLSADRQRREALRSRLSESERAIGQTARRLREINTALQQQQQRLSTLEAEQIGHDRRLRQQQQILAQQLRSAYAMGRQQRLKILLNQEDPAIVSRLMVYYDYLNNARLAEMARIEALLEVVTRGKAQIAQEQSRLLALQAEELAEQARLQQIMEERQQVVVALEQALQDKGQRLESLVRDREQLQGVIEKLQRQILSIPLAGDGQRPFKELKGTLRWPLQGSVSAGYGSARAGGMKLEGVIIDAAPGSEIRAVHRGRVAFADWLRGFGLLLILDHGEGYMTLYGHNQSLFRETGEWVEAGEVVASVGSSGGRARAGVYFGIRINGKPANPRRWFQRQRGKRVSASMGRASPAATA